VAGAFWMRNRVTHGYFDIDPDVVWNTIINDLPALEGPSPAGCHQGLHPGERATASE
jgi:hypothetical protein